MEIGLVVKFGENAEYGASFVRSCSKAIEACGFHSLWVPEHVVVTQDFESVYPYPLEPGSPVRHEIRFGAEYGMYDPLLSCQALAMHTRTLHVGTSVALLPLRHPLMWARQVATIDHLTEGRFHLGIGVGWLSEEYEALGLSFEDRGRYADESLEAIRMLWTESVSAYNGKYIRFERALSYPKPLQSGGPPIYIGGESVAALRRTARYADGWYAWNMTPDEFARKLDELAAQLRQHSFWDGTTRHLDDLTLQVGVHFSGAVGDLPALLEPYHALGANRVLLRIILPPNDHERVLSELALALELTPPATI